MPTEAKEKRETETFCRKCGGYLNSGFYCEECKEELQARSAEYFDRIFEESD